MMGQTDKVATALPLKVHHCSMMYWASSILSDFAALHIPFAQDNILVLLRYWMALMPLDEH